MRRLTRASTFLGVLFAGCAQSASVSSETFPEADANAIRSAREGFQTAVRDTAWATWASFYTSDAVFGPPNTAPITSHDGLLQFARSLPPISDFTLREVDLQGRGDLAYVYGRYSFVSTPPGMAAAPDSGKYIEIWRKQADGTWKITRDIFNSDVPLPAPPPAPAARRD